MVDHNLLVILGPTPDSYFITYGRKFSHQNAPDDLVQTFMKEPDMNPIGVAWLSLVLQVRIQRFATRPTVQLQNPPKLQALGC